MKKLLTLSAALLVALGASVAIVLLYDGASPVTAAQVVTRMESAQSELAGAVGPNTTFHQSVTIHNDQAVPTDNFALPADFVRDTWVQFDASGVAHGYQTFVRGLDGTLYQRSVADDTSMTITDIATGHTKSLPSGPMTAAAVAQGIVSAQNLSRQDLAQPAAAANPTTVNGASAYVLTFQTNPGAIIVWIDATSYLPVRYEYHAGNAAGAITRTEDVTAFAVLPGQVAPPTSGTAVPPPPPASTDTSTPSPAPATATPTATATP